MLKSIVKSIDVEAIAISAGVGIGGELVKTDLQAQLNLIELSVASVHLAKKSNQRYGRSR